MIDNNKEQDINLVIFDKVVAIATDKIRSGYDPKNQDTKNMYFEQESKLLGLVQQATLSNKLDLDIYRQALLIASYITDDVITEGMVIEFKYKFIKLLTMYSKETEFKPMLNYVMVNFWCNPLTISYEEDSPDYIQHFDND